MNKERTLFLTGICFAFLVSSCATYNSSVTGVEYGVATGTGGFGTRYTTHSWNEEPDEPLYFEGLAAVEKNRKYGYVDKTGKYVIEPKFDKGSDFSENLAGTEVNGKWGYIDKTGNFIIEPKFDKAEGFSEGLAGARVNGKWGYIDKTGKFVIEPKFDNATNFYRGKSYLMLNGNWVYIDKTGKVVSKE